MNSFFTFLFVIGIFLPHHNMSMENKEQFSDQDFEQLMQLMQKQTISNPDNRIKPYTRQKKQKQSNVQDKTDVENLVKEYFKAGFKENIELFPDWFIKQFDVNNLSHIKQLVIFCFIRKIALDKDHINIFEYSLTENKKLLATYDYTTNKITCSEQDINQAAKSIMSFVSLASIKQDTQLLEKRQKLKKRLHETIAMRRHK